MVDSFAFTNHKFWSFGFGMDASCLFCLLIRRFSSWSSLFCLCMMPDFTVDCQITQCLADVSEFSNSITFSSGRVIQVFKFLYSTGTGRQL